MLQRTPNNVDLPVSFRTQDSGLGFSFKKWQADNVAKSPDSEEVEAFIADNHTVKKDF